MKRRTSNESGFTLLELLISLAMMAVIVVFCLMAVRLATASREAGIQKTDLHQRLRVLHERLNTTLHSAHLIFVSAESKSLLPDEKEEQSSNPKVLAFEGKPESLRFVTFGEKLMGGSSSPWMHEVHFYLQKNEDTGLMEILLNERDFSQKNFFKQGSPELDTGQTLRIAQDVAYLKFRYYYEISEKGNSEDSSEEKPVKVSGQWADTMTTEPFDFKSNISGTKDEEPIRIPKAVEVSVGLWKPDPREEGLEPQQVELPPILIPIQTGMVFERTEKEEEIDNALEE
jgi:prepilin-type N-terminal cleavage/methylation domain-containing protein